MLQENYRIFYDRLSEKLDKSRIYQDPLYTLAFGTDASFYRLIPRMVVMAKDEEEVSFILFPAGSDKACYPNSRLTAIELSYRIDHRHYVFNRDTGLYIMHCIKNKATVGGEDFT